MVAYTKPQQVKLFPNALKDVVSALGSCKFLDYLQQCPALNGLQM